MYLGEVNFDGLVGPTHNYAGLSFGNKASGAHKGMTSHPRMAALQGLKKAKALADRGIPQAILPPHERPSTDALRKWGIKGKSDRELIENAALNKPGLLAAASSASAMWTANAFTMTPSIDSDDDRVHFTPANLSSNRHRKIETAFTGRLLKRIFADEERFAIHKPLPAGAAMADEGAANHIRLFASHDGPGLHLFVYGRCFADKSQLAAGKFPARQTRESFEAIARHHKILDNRALFLQQSPDAIDAGVFHNDVICLGTRSLLFLHEDAFARQPETIDLIRQSFHFLNQDAELQVIQVGRDSISLEKAVKTYLFNSQLVELPEQGMLLVVPSECMEDKTVSQLLKGLVDDSANPIREVLSFDLRESMRNGGGPACLRNRIVLNHNEIRHLTARVMLDKVLYEDLVEWINRHYREKLDPADLADPSLLDESRTALDELSSILHLPGIYDFQQ